MADEKKKKDKKHWFKELKTELKKVTWLTPKQLVKNTAAVIVLVLIVAVIVFVLDRIFLFVDEQGIEKLKEYVQSNKVVEETQENSTENNTDNTQSAIEEAVDNAIKVETTTENDDEKTTNVETNEENEGE